LARPLTDLGVKRKKSPAGKKKKKPPPLSIQ